MTNIKIALTNLGKYNEGELVYTWLELPATTDEIGEAFEEIGVAPNTEYEEHFISDYEAPFEIEEYANLAKLNEVAEVLEGLDIPEAIFDGSYDGGDVINFAKELCNENIVSNADELVQDIVHTVELDEMVAQQVQYSGWGWIRVKNFLAGIDYTRDEYYYINGYGNAENLSRERLESIVSDLMNELKHELGL